MHYDLEDFIVLEGHIKYLRNSINHVDAQLYAAVSMIRPGVRNSTYTVVAVTEQLDPQTVVLICQLVKPFWML